MKLLKFSIFLVFILSLLSAGLTFYLSNVRENEKEKRLYLEGVKARLETRIQDLEVEIGNLESENQALSQQLREEKSAKEQVLALVRDRDSALKNLEGEAQKARQAFEEAQKRNQELEKILDELETRMQEMEAQRTAAPSETAMVGLEVLPPSDSNPPASVNIEPVHVSVPSVSEPGAAPQAESVSRAEMPSTSAVTPVTEAPKPPKKRRKLFGFFRSSKSKESESKAEEAPKSETVSEEVSTSTEVTTKEATVVEEPKPQASPTASTEKPAEEKPAESAPQASQQTIAAGSVLLINRVHNFIVVNLGSRHGLALNDILRIQQGGEEIGKVRVEKLYEDYCAAYIVEEQSGKPVKEGDVVNAV